MKAAKLLNLAAFVFPTALLIKKGEGGQWFSGLSTKAANTQKEVAVFEAAGKADQLQEAKTSVNRAILFGRRTNGPAIQGPGCPLQVYQDTTILLNALKIEPIEITTASDKNLRMFENLPSPPRPKKRPAMPGAGRPKGSITIADRSLRLQIGMRCLRTRRRITRPPSACRPLTASWPTVMANQYSR
jgi:hypothetical protein